ncbi:MAG: hypothetical protein KA792_04025 [Bacteroidales bacterium]|nr:hypothetical protein [Bacteroidales bacterium]
MKFIKKSNFNLYNLLFGLLFILLLYFTMQRHSKTGYFNYRSEIWADKAGYYVYLPALLIYNFDANKFPKDMDDRTGNGFNLDESNNKIRTKYTCGVALLQLPFFAAAHLYAKVSRYEADAYSPPYHKAMNVGAVFYLVLGLYLLFKILSKYFSAALSFFTTITLLAGTNLLYYGIDETLMSHVFSFSVFCILIYLNDRLASDNFKNIKLFAMISLFVAISVLLRPTNIIIVLVILFWDIYNIKRLKQKLVALLNVRYLLILAGAFIVILLPQALYWYYLSGKFIFYSYGNEGFSNWNAPKFAEVWFSPNNGLFLYSPFLLLVIIAIIFMLFKRMKNSVLLALLFIFISYLCGSWHNWYFGCSYGQRSFVDFYGFFVFPLAFLGRELGRAALKFVKYIYVAVVLIFIYYNVMMIISYKECYFGDTWSWDEYIDTVEKSCFISFAGKTFTYSNDFENTAIVHWSKVSKDYSHSYDFSGKINENDSFFVCYQNEIQNIKIKKLNNYVVGLWVYYPDFINKGAKLVVAIDEGEKSIYWEGFELDKLINEPDRWFYVQKTVNFPAGINPADILKIYVWNERNMLLYVDDFYLKFE